METAGVTEIANRRVGKCSGGEQQRVRFAMALVSDPELLILDEPTTGMDVATRRAFWDAIRDDAERGRTVLFATHYLEEADAYADRIVLVRQGRVVADGTPSEIKALGSGRAVRATWEGATRQALRGVPGVDSVDIRGDQLLVHAKDSDAVARFLLTQTPARDLEIVARGIEDAFVALTGDEAPTDPLGGEPPAPPEPSDAPEQRGALTCPRPPSTCRPAPGQPRPHRPHACSGSSCGGYCATAGR